MADTQPMAPTDAELDAPLSVFSKGPWTFKETGQNFSGAELDEAAFVAYRNRASHGQAPAQAAGADRHGLPPLPDPDLRDVGTNPEDIKNFLRGYATEYAKAALASSAPADSVLEDAARESEYRRGYRHGYEQREAEVRGALA